MQRKIVYLINPISGGSDKKRIIDTIAQKTRQQAIDFEILPTNAEGNYYFLKEKIHQEHITDVVICGGDGTVGHVVHALIDEPVQVGILPLGSGNGLAFAAKIPKNLEKALQIVFNGKSSFVDAFFINSSFSCMLCGLGFDAQVAHDFAKLPSRGLKTYVKQTLIEFFRAKPYAFEISTREGVIQTQAYFISIANSNQFGNNFTIAPKASLSDGLLDVVVVTKMNKLNLLIRLLRQIKSGQVQSWTEAANKNKGVLYFQTNKLVIQNTGNAPMHIDGDPVASHKKISITLVPQAYRLIQP
jgi:diacylglycerol kinase (ATP)